MEPILALAGLLLVIIIVMVAIGAGFTLTAYVMDRLGELAQEVIMSTHFDRIFWDHDKKKPAEQIVDVFLLDLYHAGYDPDMLGIKRPEYLRKVRAILKASRPQGPPSRISEGPGELRRAVRK